MNIRIIAILIIIFTISCKNSNRHNTDSNQIEIVYNHKIIKDKIQKKETDILLYNYIVDTFLIRGTVFATVFIVEGSIVRNDTIKTGAYLTILPSSVFDISIEPNKLYDTLDTFYQIKDSFMEKKYFSDISSSLELDSIIVLNYSIPSEPPETTENSIIYVSNKTLKQLLFIHPWNTSLPIVKKNDSIFNIMYTDRDTFGYFHNDYVVEINKCQMDFKLITPDIQKTNFQTPLLDTLIIYLTKEEALRGNALKDSLIAKKEEYIVIELIYWNLNIIKVNTRNGYNGFVKITEIGRSIDINRAG